MGPTSTDYREYREEDRWYGQKKRTYDDGTVEYRKPGWYNITHWEDDKGNSGTERESNGTTYRKDQNGNCTRR